MLNNRITVIDNDWVRLKNNIKLLFIPRQGELIELDKEYFKVINIIHSFDTVGDVFIVVEKINK